MSRNRLVFPLEERVPRGGPERTRIVQHYFFTALRVSGLLAVVAIFIIPYLWMVVSSVRPSTEVFTYVNPVTWRTFLPTKLTSQYFRALFWDKGFMRYVFNSLSVAVVVVPLSCLVSAMGAYIFARFSFPGKDFLFMVVISTMLVPFEATIIPMYLVVSKLGLQNTRAALIVPWIASPFGVFLLRQFMAEIPKQLDEAAFIDGCSHFGVFWKVVLPNLKPALVTFALISFLWSWDSFFWPLVVIQTDSKQVIQVAIATLNTPEYTEWGLIFAGSTMASLPVLVLFLFLQRYYVRGIVLSGLKA
ncbi:MAG: carbohydrate ABC transporter permease [Bacillota bacterium]